MVFYGSINLSLASDSEILDYGRARFFWDRSIVNNLFIQTQGRMKIEHNGVSNNFYLLAPHPRELTFNDGDSIYGGMISQSGGASTISFTIDDYGNAVVSRRFQIPKPKSVQHSCYGNPFGIPSRKPNALTNEEVLEVKNDKELLRSALSNDEFFGVVEYEINHRKVRVDFPINLINFNPNGMDSKKKWQAVSQIVPVYIGGEDYCNGITEGYVAIRDFKGLVEFVYLCSDATEDVSVNDYKCVLPVSANARVFVKVKNQNDKK